MRCVGASLFSLLLSACLALGGCGYDDGQDYSNNPPPPGNLELNSGTLGTGASYSHVFADSGAFPYHCTLHPCMAIGTVNVTGGGEDSALVNITTPGGACPGGYVPLVVSVKPGASVRWANQSVAHTVTSN